MSKFIIKCVCVQSTDSNPQILREKVIDIAVK